MMETEIGETITEKESLIFAFDAKRLFNNFTGLGNYSRSLVKNLQSAFPEHRYHLFTPKAKRCSETEYFFDPEKFTIHTPSLNHPLWRVYGMSSAINRLKPHIFHGLSHEIPFGIQNGIQKVVSFHDLIYERFPEQFGCWDRMMYKLKYRSSAKRANHIIAISESTKNDLLEYYHLDPDKIQIIYQSCHPAFQDEDRAYGSLPAELTGLNDYYLYVGSIIERKGLLNIVFAYAQLAEEHRLPFVVIGRGDKSYMSKVKDMIRYYELETYFYFISNVDNDGLVNIYDQSIALIYPSIYEGFGIPIIEALFRKKPVVTSDISSLPEAAGPGAILVNPYNPKDIFNAMTKLHDSDLWESLSENGYEYVKNHFSSEIAAQNLMDFYSGILK